MKDMERISVLLQKQKELEKEQHEEFERIADECEREGYPSHGSNYSLRVEQINREYYQPEFDRIADELEAAGLDLDELEYMDDEERYEALEDAGLDPDDFDF